MISIEPNQSKLVFIPAAGLGSRVESYGLAKPLITVGGQPLIWKVLDLYPDDSNFVVAIGHQAELVREVLDLYSELRGVKITVIETDSHISERGGLTKTLRDCRSHLQQPFVFHAVDTYFDIGAGELGWLSLEQKNLLVVSPAGHAGDYRRPTSGALERIRAKEGDVVYVGVSRIADWQEFWLQFDTTCKSDEFSEEGEALGISGLQTKLATVHMKGWFDAGNPLSLQSLLSKTSTADNVLPKSDEAIWHRDGLMFKMHKSQEFISKRISRSIALREFVPDCQQRGDHMFSYERQPGQVLSHCERPDCFSDFLDHCRKLWGRKTATSPSKKDQYRIFYEQKTRERVSLYLAKYPQDSAPLSINGVMTPSIFDMLGNFDWEAYCVPELGLCHGDLHPENVLHDHESGLFTLLDWRQDIAGSTDGDGDVYYDLAKILHGLIVDHGQVAKNGFGFVEPSISHRQISIQLVPRKEFWISTFIDFLEREGFQPNRVWNMTALVYLNIAGLHHNPYDRFLFSLGCLMLAGTDTAQLDVTELISSVRQDSRSSNISPR